MPSHTSIDAPVVRPSLASCDASKQQQCHTPCMASPYLQADVVGKRKTGSIAAESGAAAKRQAGEQQQQQQQAKKAGKQELGKQQPQLAKQQDKKQQPQPQSKQQQPHPGVLEGEGRVKGG